MSNMIYFRIEKDYMGEIKVPSDKLWGAQTQRAIKHFNVSTEKIPSILLFSLILLKKAAAKVNNDLGLLDNKKTVAIIQAIDEIIVYNKHLEQFPLVIWQSGSGTQFNMNINEVIANIASKIIYGKTGYLHPNDDININQSSNDLFPTAMHIAAVDALQNFLIPQLKKLEKVLNQKSKKFEKIIKIGRTHLQDATPLTLGQEVSGWSNMITNNRKSIQQYIKFLLKLVIGGTVVGNGLNAHPKYSSYIIKEIIKLTRKPFSLVRNKFSAIATCDVIVQSHGTLKSLAVSLMKISNDIKILASGPRCGIGEIIIPENEPGSSIMPGKVNPTQCEVINMICCQVMGNDVAISIGGSLGNLELNTFRPMIIYNYLQSIRLLSEGINNFINYCVIGITPNISRIKELLSKSLMLVTVLSQYIGYDKSSEIARKAHKENISLKESALKLNYLTEKEFDKIVCPKKMIKNNV